MQLLGTLDGMEPVARQIGEHRGSPGFPWVAWKWRTWVRGRTLAPPSAASASTQVRIDLG